MLYDFRPRLYGLSVYYSSKYFLFSIFSVYHKKLEDDIISDTSGHFKRLMVSMANVSTVCFSWKYRYFNYVFGVGLNSVCDKAKNVHNIHVCHKICAKQTYYRNYESVDLSEDLCIGLSVPISIRYLHGPQRTWYTV